MVFARELVSPEQMTAIAQWLNNTFGSIDHAILQFYHNVHEACGKPLDIFVQYFTKLGDGGIFLIVLALFCCSSARPEKSGSACSAASSSAR